MLANFWPFSSFSAQGREELDRKCTPHSYQTSLMTSTKRGWTDVLLLRDQGGGNSKELILLYILLCEWTYTRHIMGESGGRTHNKPHLEKRWQHFLQNVATLESQCLWVAGFTIHRSKSMIAETLHILPVTCECLWCPQVRNPSHCCLL